MVGVCHTGFQKEGLGSGFSLKKEGPKNENWKICVLRVEILAQTRLKMQEISNIENGGGVDISVALMVNW